MRRELDGCRIDRWSRPDGSELLEISGELDSVNAADVTQIVCDLVARADVTLDLGGVRFVDSSGLRALLRGAGSAREAGHSMRLANVTPRTAKLIDLAGVTGLMDLTE
jgi:anti-anti-sigma factor